MAFMFANSENNARYGEFSQNRVSIQGCENVAPASLYSLLLNQAIDELVLIGKGNRELLRQIRILCEQFPPKDTSSSVSEPAKIFKTHEF